MWNFVKLDALHVCLAYNPSTLLIEVVCKSRYRTIRRSMVDLWRSMYLQFTPVLQWPSFELTNVSYRFIVTYSFALSIDSIWTTFSAFLELCWVPILTVLTQCTFRWLIHKAILTITDTVKLSGHWKICYVFIRIFLAPWYVIQWQKYFVMFNQHSHIINVETFLHAPAKRQLLDVLPTES